ncbi:Glycerol kinase [Monascus purpureus]|uniref:glycerol kinase n=1 Tax=Monascus purpureus TaxID=5098 RepID=A0A507QM95_MONPU|nr:Glycerol kinase [Monascus purpureus]BDD61043.1 hypothetical protein MAP00_006123 [Monascus purpureus]
MRPTELFVGSIVQGTTESKFVVVNRLGESVASHQVPITQYYPRPGWHELDPLELVSSVEHCIDKAIKKYEDKGLVLNNIKGIGIANQRETTVVWDSVTGEPLYNAIAWSDTRSIDIVRELKQKPEAGQLQQISGLPLSTYPSASKLLWLLANVPKVKEAYEQGSLAFGTVDTWLVFRLNGGPKANVFVTDSTNASRTMFMNLKKLEYDDFLLNFFDIKGKVHLPRIAPSSDLNAYGSITSGILAGTPILSCLGDQSASLVGQMGFSPGMAKNSYGMGSFTLYNVGYKPVVSQNGLLGTVAYQFDGKAVYALEGSVAVAGSAIEFLQSNFEFIKHPEDINALAQTVDDNGGVVFVTGFSGLYAPYWVHDAKGTLLGLTLSTKKGHIARAALEAVCFQTKAILEAMELDSGHKLSELAVDGDMAASDLAMQIQADLINIPVHRTKSPEIVALGAAIAAGLAFGLWRNFEEMQGINHAGKSTFEPRLTRGQSAEQFSQWDKAVRMIKTWSEDKTPVHVHIPPEREEGDDESASNANSSRVTEDIIGMNTHEVGLSSDFDDLAEDDEDDLMMEIRKIEIMQKLKKMKKGKAQSPFVI